MEYRYLYLRKVNEICFLLDHRLTPELSACLCAMASRLPEGGIEARYLEILTSHILDKTSMKKETWEGLSWQEKQVLVTHHELDLTEYPLPAKVQRFIDTNIAKYGHSSPLELTGNPRVYIQDVSIPTCHASFNSPLVAGQEFSTRAVRRRDWPLCYELQGIVGDSAISHLKALHEDWFEVNEAETAWWKEHYSDPENRKRDNIGDDEPFRPALDRARWSIPSTAATGCAHTANLRVMARVINDHLALSRKEPSVRSTWEKIAEAYAMALPGFKGLGLKEALDIDGNARMETPQHLVPRIARLSESDMKMIAENGVEVGVFHTSCDLTYVSGYGVDLPVRARGPGTYVDPIYNHMFRAEFSPTSSWGVVRDWCRHRTGYPWSVAIAMEARTGSLVLHPYYAPKSEIGIKQTPVLLRLAGALVETFLERDQPHYAMMALPLGAACPITASFGLRDLLYTLELRSMARGKNFEYEAQALEGLRLVKAQLGADHFGRQVLSALWPDEA